MDETWELILKRKSQTLYAIDVCMAWDATVDELRLPIEFMLRPMVGLIDTELSR